MDSCILRYILVTEPGTIRLRSPDAHIRLLHEWLHLLLECFWSNMKSVNAGTISWESLSHYLDEQPQISFVFRFLLSFAEIKDIASVLAVGPMIINFPV